MKSQSDNTIDEMINQKPKFFKFAHEDCNIEEFISFWRQYYDEGKYPDKKYESNLNKNGLLDEDGIKYLWEWKNGNPLSKKKQLVIKKTIEKLADLNNFRKLDRITSDGAKSLWEIAGQITNGFVWRIFVLHMARPQVFPIFDQHVFRAFTYLTTGEIPEKMTRELKNYDAYRKFFFSVVDQSKKEDREVDQALMAFGQYLQSYG